MKVKELINKLKQCSPDSIVEIKGYNCRAQLITVSPTWYNSPDNKYVVLGSEVSEKPIDVAVFENDIIELRKSVLGLTEIVNQTLHARQCNAPYGQMEKMPTIYALKECLEKYGVNK